jgi:hypothetical protein
MLATRVPIATSIPHRKSGKVRIFPYRGRKGWGEIAQSSPESTDDPDAFAEVRLLLCFFLFKLISDEREK